MKTQFLEKRCVVFATGPAYCCPALILALCVGAAFIFQALQEVWRLACIQLHECTPALRSSADTAPENLSCHRALSLCWTAYVLFRY